MPDDWLCEDCLYKMINKRATRSGGSAGSKVNYHS